MSATPRAGYSAAIYYLDGVRASWGTLLPNGRRYTDTAPEDLVLIDNTKDIALPAEATEFDVTTRGTSGFEAIFPTLFKVGFDLTMVYDLADPGCAAMLNAALTRVPIPLAILDRTIDDPPCLGFWADFSVTLAEQSQKLAEAQMVTFRVRPGLSAVAPEWVILANLAGEIVLSSPQAGTTVGAGAAIVLTWSSTIGFTYAEIIIDIGEGGEASLGFFESVKAITGADLGGAGAHTITIVENTLTAAESNSITVTRS